MSLISPRHLLAPFTSLVHVTSIVLLTIVFVVLRLSGGALEVIPDGSPEAERFAPVTAQVPPPASGALEESPASRQELLHRLAGKEKGPPAGPAGTKSLDDIEKSLGLK